MAKADLTAARLRDILLYTPETGEFTYKTKRGICPAGSVAGSAMVRGNWSIGLDYRRYSAHRLAWLYVQGEWPCGEVDHINGNPLDNRWCNLRLANSGQNKQNQHRPRSDNKSGYLGVHFHPQTSRWRARIQLDGRSIHVGLFNTPEEAHQAYLQAKRDLHPFGTL